MSRKQREGEREKLINREITIDRKVNYEKEGKRKKDIERETQKEVETLNRECEWQKKDRERKRGSTALFHHYNIYKRG